MKVILYMAISANGLVAKVEGDVDFVEEDSFSSYYRICKNVGNLIVGRNTYNAMPEGEFLEGVTYVVVTTKRDLKKKVPNVEFVSNPKEALELLNSKGFENTLVGGGGKLNGSFMSENLVDEIYLDVEPVVFGKGIPLFSHEDFEFDLELLETKKLNQSTVQLHYKVKK